MIINPTTKIKLTPIIGLDVETSGLDPRKGKVLVIAISTQDGNTYVFQCGKYSDKYLKALMEGVAKCDVVIMHNAKFDVSFLSTNYGILLRNVFDTMLAAQIINNGLKGIKFNLPSVLYKYTGVKLIESEDKERLQKSFVGLSLTDELTQEQLEYAGDDTKYLIKAYEALTECLRRDRLDKIMALENKLVPVLAKMEIGGCLIDRVKWTEEIRKWERKLKELQEELNEIVFDLLKEANITAGVIIGGKLFQIIDLFGTISINYGSQKQILDLFRALGEPVPIDKDSKPSVGEDAIKAYINEFPDTKMRDFLDLMLDYREYGKLVSTYGASFLELLDENDYVTTNYSQCRTKTGRLSSSNPNLQNIPNTQSGAGGVLRDYFIASEGNVMITSDMSSAEVRIAADYSKEQFLLDSLYKGLDMHSELATESFSIIYQDDVKVSKSEEPVFVNGYRLVPADLRQEHKTVLFAKFYKAGAKRVHHCLGKHINLVYKPQDRAEIAGKISKAIDDKMPMLTEYLSNLIEQAKRTGFLRGSKLGRIRYFDSNVYGEAANYPIQNTNGEAMKIALIKIDEYFEKTGTGRLVLTVHDEVLCEVQEDAAEEAAKVIKEIMSSSLQWFLDTVDGGASVKIKHCWEK